MNSLDLMAVEPYILSSNISDKSFLVYGAPATRKTTVGAGFPDHIAAVTERGYKFIPNIMKVHIENWNDWKRFVRELERAEVQEKYKIVMVDRVDTLYTFCYNFICAAKGVTDAGDVAFGKVWRAIRYEFEKSFNKIDSMGWGLYLTAHEEIMVDDAQNYKGTKVDLDKRPAAIIRGLVDFILHLKKEIKDGEPKNSTNMSVYAYSQSSDADTKSRLRYFPERFEFTYENLERHIVEGQNKLQEVSGIKMRIKNRDVLVKRPFAEVKENVLTMAQALLDSGDNKKISDFKLMMVENIPKGMRMSEMADSFYDTFVLMETFLIDL